MGQLAVVISSRCIWQVHLGVLEATEQLHPHLLEVKSTPPAVASCCARHARSQSCRVLLQGLGILVQLSRIDDMETFKICLEYWQVSWYPLIWSQGQCPEAEGGGSRTRGWDPTWWRAGSQGGCSAECARPAALPRLQLHGCRTQSASAGLLLNPPPPL